MTSLRIGTRGSALARAQTKWASEKLATQHTGLKIEIVVLSTAGDQSQANTTAEAGWSRGAFVGTLERALLDGSIDVAVHSMKDLPTTSPEGLVVAAIPQRAAVEDVIVSRRALTVDDLTRPLRIGTGSARRRAQLLREAAHEIVPIRGNVPTRIRKLESESLDAIVLAAAGVARLNISPQHMLTLPADRFVPAPAQGALALQTRSNDRAHALVGALDQRDLRRAVTAERALMHEAEAGCQTPLGAWAQIDGTLLTLRGQLFALEGTFMGEGVMTGDDPDTLGRALARSLLAKA